MAGTRWVKIDLSYLRNPKVTAVSQPAVLLHLASILWTADQLQDGHIPRPSLDQVFTEAFPKGDRNGTRREQKRQRVVDELVNAGLWVPNGDGWLVHDFEVMNPQAMRQAVEAQRARWKERQDRHRGRHP